MNTEKLKIKIYFDTVILWEELCILHKKLFDLTNEEYLELLSGQVDKLVDIIDEKSKIVKKINSVDFNRLKILNDINNDLNIPIKSYKELLQYFSDIKIEQRKSILKEFNNLLIDIVKKIQEQNKKNQLFLNKAICSLDEISERAPGRVRNSTYDSTGSLKGRNELSDLMSIGRTGLNVSKQAIETTSHNISNANTEGYSRQRIDQQANRPVRKNGIIVGTGASINGINRVEEKLLTKKIINTTSENSFHKERDIQLRQVEELFNEVNADGLHLVMGKFFNAFRDLATEPENETMRSLVRDTAEVVTRDFRRIKPDT